ncbi:hypothetical protein NPIL_462081 [Nephila pilipes]|uniref:Uncharacterized protein n=1 Tax=Nephila pilipes TaxID=299642 RepID=A0A8X6MJ38_NEPPI|nr:hypothetical protein NPIL_462081 [Nephila pilipes]
MTKNFRPHLMTGSFHFVTTRFGEHLFLPVVNFAELAPSRALYANAEFVAMFTIPELAKIMINKVFPLWNGKENANTSAVKRKKSKWPKSKARSERKMRRPSIFTPIYHSISPKVKKGPFHKDPARYTQLSPKAMATLSFKAARFFSLNRSGGQHWIQNERQIIV